MRRPVDGTFGTHGFVLSERIGSSWHDTGHKLPGFDAYLNAANKGGSSLDWKDSRMQSGHRHQCLVRAESGVEKNGITRGNLPF